MHTDVDHCMRLHTARGCASTVRESALKAGSVRKFACRTRESNPRLYDEYCCAWLSGPTLYHPSYPKLPDEEGGVGWWGEGGWGADVDTIRLLSSS